MSSPTHARHEAGEYKLISTNLETGCRESSEDVRTIITILTEPVLRLLKTISVKIRIGDNRGHDGGE